MKSSHNQITFTDADVADIGSFIPKGEYNPHNVHPWIIHDAGFTLAVVFASNLQDALDIAVDENKLDQFMIKWPEKDTIPPKYDEIWDYVHEVKEGEGGKIGDKWYDFNDSVSFLGNAGEPFDIDNLDYQELANPPYSFCAMFNAANQ